MKTHLFTKIIFALFTFLFILPSSVFAADSTEGSGKLLEIYCNRRKGGQLNLETWYGGRCGGTLEEGIGFGDIILLDIMEKLGGTTPEAGMLDSIIQELGDKEIINDASFQKMNPLGKSIALSLAISQIKEVNQNNGAIAYTGKAISFLYANPPASSIDYLADIGSRLTNRQIVKPAYAAETGYGFQALSAILPVWRVFRNMAYLIFALAFILYGLMIMFQIKLSAQTVASIETAIPKLIITLVLISFSYAIAGFLIDIFYLITGLIFSVFIAGNVLKPDNWGVISGQSLGVIGSGILYAINVVTNIGLIISGILSIPAALGGMLATIIAPISIIIALILLITIVITFAKIFWMLLKAYVNILIAIIFSPLMLLGNIMPGSTAFSNWVKGIFAELSVFATTMILLVLSFYFFGGPLAIGVENVPVVGTGFWQPYPLFGNLLDGAGIFGITGLGGDNVTAGKFAILSLGMLFIIPKTADMIRTALQTQGLGFESAIGDALKGGWSPIRRPISDTWNKVKKPYSEALDTEIAARAPGINKETRTFERRPPPTPPTPAPHAD